jgi:hypothetical protein
MIIDLLNFVLDSYKKIIFIEKLSFSGLIFYNINHVQKCHGVVSYDWY